MNNLVEQMIQIVESNAVDNKAVIPDVEAWAIAWREESSNDKVTSKTYDHHFDRQVEMAKIIGSYSGFIKTLVIDIRTHRKYPAKSETDFLNYLETECTKADDELKDKWNKLFN
jgi:hypothetical protein